MRNDDQHRESGDISLERDPMTMTDYLRVVRRQWYVVVLISALALGAAAAYTFAVQPVYEAETRLFVSVSGNDASAMDLQQGSTFTQQRVKSYADLVDSPEVLQKVIDQLQLPYSTEKLSKKITAESPLDTVLLNITVDDTNPQLAANIANTFAPAFADYIAQIETPASVQAEGDGSSPVKVSVTKRAATPDVPVSPSVPLNLALGLVVGLALGFGAALLREQTNTSVRSVADLEKLLGAVPLGAVPYDRSTHQKPLVDAADSGGRSEAFRALRTNLQFISVDEPPRVIVVTSPLPDEGKSTTSCNIASTLALSGASVALVEGDLRKPSLSKYLGVSSAAGLTNVLAGQFDLRDVLIPYGQNNMAVLPSGPKPPNPSELLGSAHMTQLIATLASHFDYVIIDAPPLLPVTDGAVLSAMVDGALLVVRHGKTRREAVERAARSLQAVNAKLLGSVLNFAPSNPRRGGYEGYGYGYGYGTPPETRQGPEAAARMQPAMGGLASIRSAEQPPHRQSAAGSQPAPLNGGSVRNGGMRQGPNNGSQADHAHKPR